MKKATLLMIALSAFFAGCSSDDGNDDGSSNDPIVGNWKLTSEKVNGEEVATPCDLTEIFMFKSNGTAIIPDLENENGDCVNQVPAGVTFTWEKVSSNKYTYHVLNNGNAVSSTTFTTVFSDNGNSVVATVIDDDSPNLVETNTYVRQ